MGAEVLSWVSVHLAPTVNIVVQFFVNAWTATDPLNRCQGIGVLALTCAMAIAIAGIRALYHTTTVPHRLAELGIDLSGSALALALTVPLAVACHIVTRGHLVILPGPPGQSPMWAFVVPAIPLVAFQANNWLLGYASNHTASAFTFRKYLSGAVGMALGITVLIFAAAFVAARSSC